MTSDVEQLFLQNTSRWLLPRSANFRKHSRMAASQRQQQRFLQCKNSHGSAYLTFLCGLSLKRFNYSDDDDDNELHLWNDWATKDVKLYLLPEPLSHNRKPPTRRKQVLNLRRTWVQTLLNEMISVTMSIHHSATSYLHRDVISRISYWFFLSKCFGKKDKPREVKLIFYLHLSEIATLWSYKESFSWF